MENELFAEWVYGRNQEKLRDQHYELLISNNFDAFLSENLPVRTTEEKTLDF